jgi:flagellar biosynthesis GTPase FlhF
LKKEAEKRQAEERERAQKETAERERAAKEEAARKKAESDMTSLFDATKDLAVAEQGGQVRKSLVINIKHPAAFVQIFQVWFEEEGTKLPVDKLEKKTLGQMKRFCEGLASKDGVIIDSPYIAYEEDFKAVAK